MTQLQAVQESAVRRDEAKAQQRQKIREQVPEDVEIATEMPRESECVDRVMSGYWVILRYPVPSTCRC